MEILRGRDGRDGDRRLSGLTGPPGPQGSWNVWSTGSYMGKEYNHEYPGVPGDINRQVQQGERVILMGLKGTGDGVRICVTWTMWSKINLGIWPS